MTCDQLDFGAGSITFTATDELFIEIDKPYDMGSHHLSPEEAKRLVSFLQFWIAKRTQE